MAGEKRFGTALFGFKQSDVNSYIEKILREFDDKLKEKDNEITALMNQCRELRIKYEDIARKTDQVSDDRVKIADVLIKAQEKAELILQEAREQAEQERKKLSEMTEHEKEKLVDIKQEIKALKQEISKTLRKYETDLDKVVEFNSLPERNDEVKSDYDSNDKEIADDLIEEIMEEYVGKAES
jgi:cell division initiation protein